MKLARALRLPQLPLLAAVGAGGKTSLLFRVGRELLGEDTGKIRSVVLTTTTHLAGWQTALSDQHVVVEGTEQLEDWERDIPAGLVVMTGHEVTGQRLGGLNELTLNKLQELANEHELPLLIEADGTRLKPLKAPAQHEPVIPSFVRQVVVCAGMQGLGKPLSEEWVHRAEIYSALAELELGKTISREAVQRVLVHPQGGMKGIPEGARRVLLLTQADTPELQAEAHAIAQNLMPYYDSVGICQRVSPSMVGEDILDIKMLNVHEPVAGIVLAAGGASRFGKPKQLLDWQGKPFVRQIAETAMLAGLSPILVVVGAYADDVITAVEGLPVQIVVNSDWEQGHATSVVRGVQALPGNAGAVVFLLSDQPQVPARLVSSLVEMHRKTLAAIVAPLVDGRRGNPVLFDRDTYGELAGLKLDQGGRQLFSRFVVQWLPWHDSSVLLDVDTEEDYQELIKRSWGGQL